jgi:hypothetical protein
MATLAQQARWGMSPAPQGVLAAIDQEQFAAYVVHADVFVEAAKAKAGQPLIDDKGFVAPLLRLMGQTTEVMVRIQSASAFAPEAVHGSVCRIYRGGAGREPASAHERFDTILPAGKVYQTSEATDANKSENAGISGLQIPKNAVAFQSR